MLRREFITAISAMLVASQMAKATAHEPACIAVDTDLNPQIKQGDYPDYSTFSTAKYPLPKLTPLLSFQVPLEMSNSRFFGHWNDEQRARATRASALFRGVWSSQEFKDKVVSIESLIWHEGTDDEAKYPIYITGAALYPKLVSSLNVTMPVKLIHTAKHQTAASGLVSTDLEESWADRANVYDLFKNA